MVDITVELSSQCENVTVTGRGEVSWVRFPKYDYKLMSNEMDIRVRMPISGIPSKLYDSAIAAARTLGCKGASIAIEVRLARKELQAKSCAVHRVLYIGGPMRVRLDSQTTLGLLAALSSTRSAELPLVWRRPARVESRNRVAITFGSKYIVPKVRVTPGVRIQLQMRKRAGRWNLWQSVAEMSGRVGLEASGHDKQLQAHLTMDAGYEAAFDAVVSNTTSAYATLPKPTEVQYCARILYDPSNATSAAEFLLSLLLDRDTYDRRCFAPPPLANLTRFLSSETAAGRFGNWEVVLRDAWTASGVGDFALVFEEQGSLGLAGEAVDCRPVAGLTSVSILDILNQHVVQMDYNGSAAIAPVARAGGRITCKHRVNMRVWSGAAARMASNGVAWSNGRSSLSVRCLVSMLPPEGGPSSTMVLRGVGLLPKQGAARNCATLRAALGKVACSVNSASSSNCQVTAGLASSGGKATWTLTNPTLNTLRVQPTLKAYFNGRLLTSVKDVTVRARPYHCSSCSTSSELWFSPGGKSNVSLELVASNMDFLTSQSVDEKYEGGGNYILLTGISFVADRPTDISEYKDPRPPRVLHPSSRSVDVRDARVRVMLTAQSNRVFQLDVVFSMLDVAASC